MADNTTTLPSTLPPVEAAASSPPTPAPKVAADPQPRPPKQRGPPLSQVYALPAPIRTFPLPSFYPNNPLSIFHLAYAWVKQLISPPPGEPSIIHTGTWDPDSRSVHIIDPVAVRALWEQGFYGKGTLSRSEPNWLKREEIRRGAAGDVSEQRTALRREERRQVKWERARTEQEALERTRHEEAQLAASGGEIPAAPSVPRAPLVSQAELELPAVKPEPQAPSEEEPVSQPSPEQAIVDTSLEAITEAVALVKEAVLTSSDAVEELVSSVNDTAEESQTHDVPPAQVDTLQTPEVEHEVQIPHIAVSSAVLSFPSVIPDAPSGSKAPVGPLELLALPNSAAGLSLPSAAPSTATNNVVVPGTPMVWKAPVGPLELLALPNSAAAVQLALSSEPTLEAAMLEESSATTAAVEAELDAAPTGSTPAQQPPSDTVSRSRSPVGPLELLALPNSLAAIQNLHVKSSALNGATVGGIKHATTLAAPNGVAKEFSLSKSPVGPLELLALPNSLSIRRSDLPAPSFAETVVVNGVDDVAKPHDGQESQSDHSKAVLPAIPEKENSTSRANGNAHLSGHTNGSIFGDISIGAGKSEAPGCKHILAVPEDAEEQPPKRRRKSVRFSATLESTTFLHCDPPSPERSARVAKPNGTASVENVPASEEAVLIPAEASAFEEEPKDTADAASAPPLVSESRSELDITVEDIENKEHLQLSAEEAFFLSYGIGALSILDPETKKPIPREELLGLFRSHSHFPPTQQLLPSDPFLVHYAVYHHFRSLGWVPRHGIKFGVDWMLYTRGPVFDHAEFGLIVMPSYSDPWWKENGNGQQEAPRKSWHWLHGVNRVLSHVLKSLVLVYVDVPPPHVFDAAIAAGGISAALKEYKVREFMVRRWSSNRNR